MESWLLGPQLVTGWFPLPEGRESPKAWGTLYLRQLTKQDMASIQIRYAHNLKAKEAFLALKASGSLRGSTGWKKWTGPPSVLTWWWNSTSSSSWTPQNSQGMMMLSSTGGELLGPIKESNWLLAACCINFWKMTSGSSTPLGEALPTLIGGKAHEGLQLVCLKKHRLKKKKSRG